MRRREFITLLGSVATGWPLIARAQRGERVRLVGILEGISADTPSAKARHTAFVEGLQQLGWEPAIEGLFGPNGPQRQSSAQVYHRSVLPRKRALVFHSMPRGENRFGMVP